jgi:hypothetical protein
MSDDQLGMYAAGYVDAFQAATMVGIREQCRQALQTCVSVKPVPTSSPRSGNIYVSIQIGGMNGATAFSTTCSSANAFATSGDLKRG